MNSYTIWFSILVLVSYLIATDDSVLQAFHLVSRLVKFQYEKVKWWILHSPSNPIVRWSIHRRSMKMAEELMKEFEDKK